MEIKVSLVDDASALRERYAALINAAPGFRCVSQHPNAAHALKYLPAAEPDVALVDIRMPKLSGIEFVRRLKLASPKPLCLMLTLYSDDKLIVDSLKAGADGYLLKSVCEAHTLTEAIRRACEGDRPLTPEVARRVMQHFRQACATESELAKLTPRESEIVSLLAQGLRNKEIAGDLEVSEHTVKDHLKSIYAKLHAAGRAEAVAKWLRR